MKKRFDLSFIAALVVLFATMSFGSLAHGQQASHDAQQQSQPAPPPDTQAPPPRQTSQPPAQAQPEQSAPPSSPSPTSPNQATPQSGQTPDATAQSAASTSNEYVGTVVKQGDKYVFQETSTGTIYDIDRQDEVKKFDGKKVRVKGTLDPTGKIIHVQ